MFMEKVEIEQKNNGWKSSCGANKNNNFHAMKEEKSVWINIKFMLKHTPINPLRIPFMLF